MKNIMKYLIAAALATALITPVFAVTINFDTLEIAGGGYTMFTTPTPGYSEAGFTLTTDDSVGLYSAEQGHGFYAGSAGMFANGVNAVITLAPTGGGTFSINSMDLSTVGFGGTSPVNFVGNISGGGTVTAGTVLSGGVGFSAFNFPTSFTNLTSLTWTQSANFHQFDNIVLNAATTPDGGTTALMLGLALVGCGAIRRKLR
jgi:hypothetical protein